MAKKRTKQTQTFKFSPLPKTAEEVAEITIQDPNIPTVYFNHARVAAGLLDVRIFLGEQTVSPIGQVSFTEKLCIAMSPEFAQIFLGLFAKQLMHYEKIFGKIRQVRSPEEIQKAINQAVESEVKH